MYFCQHVKEARTCDISTTARRVFQTDFLKHVHGDYSISMVEASNESLPLDPVRLCCNMRDDAFDLSKGTDLMRTHVVKCVSTMRSFPKDSKVQNCGTLALAALCERHDLEEFIGKSGGMEALLLSLSRFKNRREVVKNTLVLFRSLFTCSLNQERFRIHGGLRLLVTLLQLHDTEEGIQRVSCSLISIIAREPGQYGFTIVGTGVVPLLMNVLQTFDTEKQGRTQLHACMALRALTKDLRQCQQVVEADWEISGVSYTLWESADPAVLCAALCVFRNVVTHQKDSVLPASTPRRINAALLQLIDRTSHLPDKYVECHEMCFAMLRTGLLGEDSGIPHDSLLQLSLSCMTTYLKTEEFRNHAVLGHICGSVRMLLFSEENRVYFRRMPDSIETLVLVIVALSSRPIRVEQALVALGNAVFDSEAAQERAQAADGIRVVAETMQKNAFSAAVTIAGLRATHAICANNPRSVDKATSLSMQATCVKMLRTFKDNPHVQETGLTAIAMLGITENGVQAMQRSSALEAARKAAKQFPFSQRILLLTEQIQRLLDGESSVSESEGNPGETRGRQGMASRLLRKLSSRLTPSE